MVLFDPSWLALEGWQEVARPIPVCASQTSNPVSIIVITFTQSGC